MILKSLEIENFRSYESASIEFSPYQNYFFGKNWQGKSSIMDAIGFALFGKNIFPTRIAGMAVKVDNLIREGAKAGSVKLSFEHKGKEYILERGCPGNSVEFVSEGKVLGQNATTVKEALYESFGLDNRLFANVFYSEQDDLRKILESNPEERKVFVEMLLGFEYLKDVKMSAKHASDELTDFIDEITSGNIKTIIDMVNDVKGQVEDKEQLVENLEGEIKKEAKPHAKFADISKRMSQGQSQTEELLGKKNKLLQELEIEKNSAKNIREGVCPVCGRPVTGDLQLKLIHELKEKIQSLETRLKAAEEAYQKVNLEWSTASVEYERHLTREQRLNDIDSQKRLAASELKKLKDSLVKYEKQYKAFSSKKKIIQLINAEKEFLDQFQSGIEAFRENLRKNMTRDLENGVNHFMSQFNDEDFDAKLSINNEFGFEVILHDKPSPIFNMSGAARDILALGVRYGLYRIAARDVNFILFDEPTRHMDSVNTLKLKQALDQMRDQQVIVITVHDDFYDAQGRKFMIEKNEDLVSVCSQIR